MAVADVGTHAPASAEPFEHLVLDFLAYLEFERGLSRNTLEAYRSDLLQYGAYLRTGATRSRSTHADLAGFVADAGRRRRRGRPPVAPATLQRKVACLRSFYRHLRRQGLLDDDPTANLRAPAQSRRLPQVLTRDEVAQAARAAAGHRAGRAARPRAARADVRLRAARVGGDRPRGRRRRPRGRHPARPRQGLQGAPRAGRLGRHARGRAYLGRGRPQLVGDRLEARLFVNHRGGGLTRQGLYKIVQRHAATAGPRGQDEPAHAAPHVRDAPAGRRLRPALAAGDARPRRHRHDPALHAPLRRAAARTSTSTPTRAPRAAADAARIAAREARAFVIVIDACGAGELPDAADYGDAGANTLGHVAEAAGGLDLPVLQRARARQHPAAGRRAAVAATRSLHGRLHPLGPGKDTITGHWELMGVVTPVPLRTYPDGFPDEIIDAAARRDRPRRSSATGPTAAPQVIDDFGERAPARPAT